MPKFTPPYPERPETIASDWRRYQLVRKNLIGHWEAPAFRSDFMATRMGGRSLFVCNSPESVRFAFNNKTAVFERKTVQMRRLLEPLIGDGLFISHGETLSARRALISPMVHLSRLPRFAPLMVEAAQEVAERWDKVPSGQPVDALADMGHLAAEVVCKSLFGRDLGQRNAEVIVGGFARFQQASTSITLLDALGLPDWFPRPPNRRVRRIVAQVNRVLDSVIADVQRDGRDCLVADLMKSAPGALTRQQLRNEAAVLFMAGHETTANTMAWAWYLISQDPEVEARLHEELDAVLGGRRPTLDDLKALTFTRAIIDETLRLYPPVPHLGRQSTAAETFQGTPMPKGSYVLVVPWLLHRHSGLWDRPDEFDPDRFLAPDQGGASKYAYVPFSVGSRVCPGQAFGLAEAMLCLATLAQRFELRLLPGHKVEAVCRMTLRPGERLPMLVRPRVVSKDPARAMDLPVGHD